MTTHMNSGTTGSESDINPTFSNGSVVHSLTHKIDDVLSPLGLETVEVEVQNGRQAILRLFIDFAEKTSTDSSESNAEKPPTIGSKVGIEDCVKASHAVDPLLDTWPELSTLFDDRAYELEVSSPGLERPLRKRHHFNRVLNKNVKIQLVRPLLEVESQNSRYWTKNTRQKIFMGVLNQVVGPDSKPEIDHLVIGLRFQGIDENITIPFHLVSKAQLVVEDPLEKHSKKGNRK